MKTKKTKKLIDSIDEKYVLMASDPENVFGKRNGSRFYKKIGVIAACLTLATAISASVFLPALNKDPFIDDTRAESDGFAEPGKEYYMVSNGSLVSIRRLSSVETNGESTALTKDGTTVNVEMVHGHIGDRFILLQFNCNEGEQIIVTTGAKSRLLKVEKLIVSSGAEMWATIDEDGDYRFAEEYYYVPRDSNKKQEAIDKKKANRPSIPGQTETESLTEAELTENESAEVQIEETLPAEEIVVTPDDILLWQYAGDGEPCIKDNFVDFKIVDADGNITGGGSIYIGGLDLVEYTGYGDYKAHSNLNAIYRPTLLGAYRFENDTPDEKMFEEIIDSLHQNATEARSGLFDDLSDDNYKIAMRKLNAEQNDAFYYKDDDGSSGYAIGVTTYARNADGTLNDSYAIVENKGRTKLFFLYNGTYQEITEYREEYYDGDKLIIRLTLADGVQVIIRPSEEIVYDFIFSDVIVET